jgi:hypothetical protein
MSLLNKIQTGRKLKPLALMLHAPHGIGKSTFASESPNPIYIGQEENDEIDAARFPKVQTWNDLEMQLSSLLNESHDFKTLVIDTIDGLEQVAEQTILASEKGKTMATAFGGFGKAYEKMKNMFLNVRDNYLIPLRDKKGMNIVILSHSKKVKHEDPMTNTSYDHYETAIHKSIKPIFEDWVSAIFFANYHLVKAENNSGKEYAAGNGVRILYTEERPSHVAKNRFDLPYEIDFEKNGTWLVVKNLVLSHYAKAKQEVKEEKKQEFNDEVNDIVKAIAELVPRIPEEIQPKIAKSIDSANGNVDELKRILKKIQGIIS